MQNVGLTSVGGVRYGYIHQEKKDKALDNKISKLAMLGCTDIVVDIGSRKNLDRLLKQATFRDHIYFYDHSVFRSIDEYNELIKLSMGDYDGDIGVNFDVYDQGLFPYYSEEATRQYRRKPRTRDFISFLVRLRSSLTGAFAK